MELRDLVRHEMVLLRVRMPDVDGCVACSVDGLTIADDLNGGAEQIGALSSALLALSRRMTSMVDKGTFEETLISGTNGYAVFYAAAPRSSLQSSHAPGPTSGCSGWRAARRRRTWPPSHLRCR
ncbi:roadblock/LC7 domain-containing protein [Streptosporangium lutulentum]